MPRRNAKNRPRPARSFVSLNLLSLALNLDQLIEFHLNTVKMVKAGKQLVQSRFHNHLDE